MDLKLVMVVMLNVAAVFCMPGGFDMRSLLDTKKRESEEALQFRALLNELKALKREDESTVDENASTVIVDDEASTVDDGPLSVDDDESSELEKPTFEQKFEINYIIHTFLSNYIKLCLKKGVIGHVFHYIDHESIPEEHRENMENIEKLFINLDCHALENLGKKHTEEGLDE